MANEHGTDPSARRKFLRAAGGLMAGGVAVGGMLGSATAPLAAQGIAASGTRSRDFVLVHGAWHGGWCWDPVRSILEGAGHRVFTPTLKGLAERAGELDASVGLEDHIEDVLLTILLNDLTDVVLCGHSYGGMVITAIADRAKSRIGHIVYLDAALPQNGESMLTYGEPRPEEAKTAAINTMMALAPDGVGIAVVPPEILGIPKDHIVYGQVAEKLTPHPLKTWLDTVALRNGGPDGLARTYVHCTDPMLTQAQFPWIASQVKNDPSWIYAELKTGHDAMLTDPSGVADILLKAAIAAKTG